MEIITNKQGERMALVDNEWVPYVENAQGDALVLRGGAWSPATETQAPAIPAAPEQDVSLGESILGGGSQVLAGLTLGHYDEIGGALLAAMGVGEDDVRDNTFRSRYIKNRDSIRSRDKRWSSRNPWSSLALNMAGGAATGGVGGSRAMAAKAAQANPLKSLAGVTGAEGAIAGAGYSEGPAAQTAADAGAGALMGAGMGLAAQSGADRVATMVRNWSKDTPKTRAGRMLKEAMDQDMMSMEDIEDFLNKNTDSRVVHAGYNLEGKGKVLTRTPGLARAKGIEMVKDMSKAQEGSIIDSLSRNTGGRYDVYSSAAELKKKMRAEASPLYDAAYQRPVEMDDKLQEYIDAPAYRAAWNKVKKALLPSKDAELDYTSLATWDAFQKRIADTRNKAYRSGALEESRDYGIRHDGLIDKLQNDNPEYAQARRIWSEDSHKLSAQEKGRKVFTDDYDDPEFGKMSPNEKTMYINGAARAMLDKIEGVSSTGESMGDPAAAVIKSTKLRKRIRKAFPDDESFDAFIDEMLTKSHEANVNKRLDSRAGSVTAEAARGLEINDAIQAADIGVNLATGSPIAAARNAARMVGSKKPPKVDHDANTTLGNILFDRNVDLMRDTLQSVNPVDTSGLMNYVTPGIIAGYQDINEQ